MSEVRSNPEALKLAAASAETIITPEHKRAVYTGYLQALAKQADRAVFTYVEPANVLGDVQSAISDFDELALRQGLIAAAAAPMFSRGAALYSPFPPAYSELKLLDEIGQGKFELIVPKGREMVKLSRFVYDQHSYRDFQQEFMPSGGKGRRVNPHFESAALQYDSAYHRSADSISWSYMDSGMGAYWGFQSSGDAREQCNKARFRRALEGTDLQIQDGFVQHETEMSYQFMQAFIDAHRGYRLKNPTATSGKGQLLINEATSPGDLVDTGLATLQNGHFRMNETVVERNLDQVDHQVSIKLFKFPDGTVVPCSLHRNLETPDGQHKGNFFPDKLTELGFSDNVHAQRFIDRALEAARLVTEDMPFGEINLDGGLTPEYPDGVFWDPNIRGSNSNVGTVEAAIYQHKGPRVQARIAVPLPAGNNHLLYAESVYDSLREAGAVVACTSHQFSASAFKRHELYVQVSTEGRSETDLQLLARRAGQKDARIIF